MTTVGSVKGVEVTAREAEILALIARHLTNAQIADALFISTRTVENHVSAMLRKLLWAEAAVLDHRDDAALRIERSRHAARDNPIAVAMVERAAAIATRDRATLAHLATTFAPARLPVPAGKNQPVGGRATGSGVHVRHPMRPGQCFMCIRR